MDHDGSVATITEWLQLIIPTCSYHPLLSSLRKTEHTIRLLWLPFRGVIWLYHISKTCHHVPLPPFHVTLSEHQQGDLILCLYLDPLLITCCNGLSAITASGLNTFISALGVSETSRCLLNKGSCRVHRNDEPNICLANAILADSIILHCVIGSNVTTGRLYLCEQADIKPSACLSSSNG